MTESNLATLSPTWEKVLERAYAIYMANGKTDSTTMDESAIAVGQAIYETLALQPGEVQDNNMVLLINSASTEELEAIKGVGPATAQSIKGSRPIRNHGELEDAAPGVDFSSYVIDFSE